MSDRVGDRIEQNKKLVIRVGNRVRFLRSDIDKDERRWWKGTVEKVFPYLVRIRRDDGTYADICYGYFHCGDAKVIPNGK